MTTIAVVGHLSRDVVEGGTPRPGGGVYYATRVLAGLGVDARVGAACSAAHRAELVGPLEAFGLPVRWHESSHTTSYRFHYEGDRRFMWQEAVGDAWTAEDALAAVADAEWVDICALARSDFPLQTLAALDAEGRRLLLDAQGLVRTAALGELRTDREIGEVLRHAAILNLNDEEATTLVGTAEPERLRALGVPELLLTLGSAGAWVVTPALVEHVSAVYLDRVVDPTGAGDTFAAAYLAARAGGADPVEAARAATLTTAELLVSRA